jgi:pSer/pThr/pTyr-binding forkhead associated (FHA) protein
MPHLITVSGGRIPLHRGQQYVLGRDKECDIVLDDGACSRRHARVVVAKTRDELLFEDLKSHNGSFVDGVLVRGRQIVPDGARIRVGGTIFLAQLTEALTEGRLAETRTFEEDDGDSDLAAGEWANVGLFPILSRLLTEGRNVTLHVALPDGNADVEVRDGEVLSARCAGLEGFNALVRLGRQGSGIFWMTEVEPDAPPCERNVTERTPRLLSELGRCLGIATPS